MLITCPNCQTQYTVSAQSMGQGRTVRCHSCHNTWRQAPVANQPGKQQPRTAHGAFPLPGLMPGAFSPGMAPPPGYGYPPPPGAQPGPPPGYPPNMWGAQPASSAAAPEAQPAAAPAPAYQEPEPKIDQSSFEEDDDDGDIFDTESLLAEIGVETDAPEPEPEVDRTPVVPDDDDLTLDSVDDDEDDEVATMSQSELDDMFGDDDIPAIASVVGGGGDDDDDQYDDPDDIPDLDDDDIPQSLTSDLNGGERQKKSGVLKWILIVFLLLLIGASAAGYFLRDMIMEMVPETVPVYEMIGLGEKLAAGFDIRDVTSERVTTAGVDTLVVKGLIANVSGRVRTVPRIRIDLFDANGESVQSTITDPVRIELPAGENAEFSAGIEAPSPLARRLEVTFVERPKADAAAQ